MVIWRCRTGWALAAGLVWWAPDFQPRGESCAEKLGALWTRPLESPHPAAYDLITFLKHVIRTQFRFFFFVSRHVFIITVYRIFKSYIWGIFHIGKFVFFLGKFRDKKKENTSRKSEPIYPHVKHSYQKTNQGNNERVN